MVRHLISPAVAGDAAVLRIIYKECRAELGSFDLYMCWQNYLKGIGNEKFDVIHPAHNRAEVRGFVRWNASKKYHTYLIKDIGVLKKHRGECLGAQLLHHVPTPLTLKCNADNELGNLFYAKMGMNRAGTAMTRSGKPQTIWTCAEW